ncbi:hypothetical protein [Rhodocaloribacter sp.]
MRDICAFCHAPACDLLVEAGFADVRLQNDLAGLPRIVHALVRPGA